MANAQDRERARADDLSQEHRPNNKIKSRGRLHGPSNFPPEFWDNLSKVWLTRRALRELDRRNCTRPAPGPAAPAVHTTDRACFARHGGPDLRHLRGVRLYYADLQLTLAKCLSIPSQRAPYVPWVPAAPPYHPASKQRQQLSLKPRRHLRTMMISNST